MSNPTAFDQFANEYDATVQAAIGASGESVAFFAELKVSLARAEAPATVRHVLDFGCGVGNSTRALAAAWPSARIVGSDPSPDSIAVARARAAQAIEVGAALEFALNSDTSLPFEEETFDLAIAACVFHHIEQNRQAHWVREIARVLRPGGRLVLFEHNPLNPLTRRAVSNCPFDARVVLLARSTAKRLLAGAGLRIPRSRYYFFFPRFLAALRPLEPLLGWVPAGAQYYIVGER